MEGNCICNEQAVMDAQQGVALQLGDWVSG
jgi:hypothetical protein